MSPWHGFRLVLALLISTTYIHAARSQTGDTESIPRAMQECELNACGAGGIEGTWTFNGKLGLATWPNGGAATLSVQQFDAQTVNIVRTDLPGSLGSGIVAHYTGTIHGDQIDGTITWAAAGGPTRTSTWHARIGNPQEQGDYNPGKL